MSILGSGSLVLALVAGVTAGVTAGSLPAAAAPADVICQGKPSDKVATAAGQTITGTDGADVISAAGFPQVVIVGGDGADVLCGSPSGSAAAPAEVRGGPGGDSIEAGPGVEVGGGEGNDSIVGAAAVLHGGEGNDSLRASGGGGTIAYGDEGNDSLDSTGGDTQQLIGGPGSDSLAAPGGIGHVLSPGAGDDTVSGPPTATLDYDGAEPVTFDVAAGVATGQGTDTFAGIRSFDGGTGADVFLGTDEPETYASLDVPSAGTSGVDAVWSRGGADRLWVAYGDVHAGDGNDNVRLLGGAAWGNTGADTLFVLNQGAVNGGSGNDHLRGLVDPAVTSTPLGSYVFHGATGRDRITLPPAGATGVVSSADGGSGSDLLDLTTVSGPTRVHLNGAVAYGLGKARVRSVERAAGSRGSDRIWGTAGPNVLDGNAGRDVLVGGRGRDVLIGGPDRDRCAGEVRRGC